MGRPDHQATRQSIESHSFVDWLTHVVRPRALASSVQPEVFDTALPRISFLPEVIARQENQTEFSQAIWHYLAGHINADRVRDGRKALRKHRDTLLKIENHFGVDPTVVTAIWGVETAFGTKGREFPVLSALASLAWRGQRRAFFEAELVAALRVVQAGHVRLQNFSGSWSGAMGHGQLMPTSFLNFAVDFDEDGRVDIWGKDPTDGLAAIARFLHKHKWRPGQPWGFEVILPDDFDYALSGVDRVLPASEWSALGVRTPVGSALPDYGPGSILLPAGAKGCALMVLRNYHVLLRYNRAESYGIAVGFLADRLGGNKEQALPWPEDDIALGKDEIRELQFLLTASGFDTYGIDGHRGPKTSAAVQRFQHEIGMVPDGYPNTDVLKRLRASRSDLSV